MQGLFSLILIITTTLLFSQMNHLMKAEYGFDRVSISDDGNTLLIGASYDEQNGTTIGSAYLFKWNGSSWSENRIAPSIDIEEDMAFASFNVRTHPIRGQRRIGCGRPEGFRPGATARRFPRIPAHLRYGANAAFDPRRDVWPP